MQHLFFQPMSFLVTKPQMRLVLIRLTVDLLKRVDLLTKRLKFNPVVISFGSSFEVWFQLIWLFHRKESRIFGC